MRRNTTTKVNTQGAGSSVIIILSTTYGKIRYKVSVGQVKAGKADAGRQAGRVQSHNDLGISANGVSARYVV